MNVFARLAENYAWDSLNMTRIKAAGLLRKFGGF